MSVTAQAKLKKKLGVSPWKFADGAAELQSSKPWYNYASAVDAPTGVCAQVRVCACVRAREDVSPSPLVASLGPLVNPFGKPVEARDLANREERCAQPGHDVITTTMKEITPRLHSQAQGIR